MRKGFWSLGVISILWAIGIGACGRSVDTSATATADAVIIHAKETENPYVPASAWIYCSPFADKGGGVALWEYPGLRPIDNDSAYSSYKGRYKGSLKECTLVEVLDRQWSIYDKTFYYLVKNKEQTGWVKEELVTFDKP